MLLRRGDVENALRNWDYSSDFGGIMGSEEPVIPLNVDPPLHGRYRRLLDPYFSPRKMAALAPAIEKHVNGLIDAFIQRGACDFSAELAVPLPCSMFLSMLGLPLSELGSLVRWKDIMVRAETLVPDRQQASDLQASTAVEIYTRFTAEMEDRRAGRRPGHRDHLPGVHIRLPGGQPWRAAHAGNRARVGGKPRRRAPGWETPVQSVSRRATGDLKVAPGCVIKAGSAAGLSLASANVGPDGLPGADSVDVRRGDLRNLAFGGGPHRCLGSHLARMDLRTVVFTWRRGIPEYALAPGTELQCNGPALRGVDHLPLVRE